METVRWRVFTDQELDVVHSALEIAEDITGDYYKISQSEWRRTRYDVKTLSSLHAREITHEAFAQLLKYSRPPVSPPQPLRVLDFYVICLQDHKILDAVERDPELTLKDLTLYVLTHELVHVVRFSRFFKKFECSEAERAEEETVVHHETYRILQKLGWPGVTHILRSYLRFREVDRIIP